MATQILCYYCKLKSIGQAQACSRCFDELKSEFFALLKESEEKRFIEKQKELKTSILLLDDVTYKTNHYHENCRIFGCKRMAIAKGFCNPHYQLRYRGINYK
jgi:hypothetical protein